MIKPCTALILSLVYSLLSFAQSNYTSKRPEVTFEKNWRTGEHKVILTREFKTRIKSRAMQLDLSHLNLNPNRLPIQPKLPSKNISVEQGVFGVKADMNIIDALSVLGIPMSEMALNDTDVLYSFGRNLWLIAKENKVHSISNTNSQISNTVKSMIAFDDRSLTDWKINGVIGHGDSKQSVEALIEGAFTSENTFLVDSESTASLEIKFVKESFAEEANWIVSDFSYGNLTEKVSLDANYITNNTADGYEVFAEILRKAESEDDKAITINALPYYPIFTAYGSEGKKIYIYDNHLIVTAKNEKIKQLYIAETLFSGVEDSTKWKLGHIYSNQASDEIEAMFKDDVFGVGDYWEVYTENLKYDFYFKRNDRSLVLDEVEIELY